MSKQLLSCVYHPTATVFVDDDEKFLRILKTKFGRNSYIYTFKESAKAVSFLKEFQANPFTYRCVIEAEDQDSDKRNIEIDIRKIREEIYNPKRFLEVTTLVLDYAMPSLNGGEIANLFKKSSFKIILLTGEADAQTAIKLFNEGVIHSYIRKDSPDFKTLLANAMADLQQEYFLDHSAIVINSLDQYHDYPHQWFKDPAFKQLFDEVYQAHQLTEYSLLDEYGSYQFLNRLGELSVLSVTTEEMMATYLDYAKNDNAPAEIIEGLAKKSLMPFFYSDDDFNVRPSEWLPFMHEAKLIKGQENYYYSYIDNVRAYKIKPAFSYLDFLKNQE